MIIQAKPASLKVMHHITNHSTTVGLKPTAFRKKNAVMTGSVTDYRGKLLLLSTEVMLNKEAADLCGTLDYTASYPKEAILMLKTSRTSSTGSIYELICCARSFVVISQYNLHCLATMSQFIQKTRHRTYQRLPITQFRQWGRLTHTALLLRM
jgi:hypothetical protein